MKKVFLIMLFFVTLAFSQSKFPGFEEYFKYDQNQTYALKNAHKDAKLQCFHCHEGTDIKEYKEVKTDTCLTCHESKEKVAKRLYFLGEKNPHNSVHDGANLSCHVCHNSHKPSFNMCNDCHNTKNWMREIK
ncbi:cytochrome c3 family protein [Campylobacter geochelonis]|uniref:Flavocytochrome C heme subunit n=1 Tax=Campylobacter geochelonis TaxID=1780362 RepID=A0A128EHP8_9BACT|nr:cytochrome c3 family protein [Campylobacter geochelonis]QKF71288.1 cytochrome c3 [Campylobacter geochelonis]CZE48117.1 flavocytochrome C heme subunit [Campylobacter geochelonis]CZE48999.1 flavocytochrome C heme subunit [Campylobacter geochelonis]CZE51093.1 flavocytochrome C heme subunit [Campylobacter geochelonis]